MDANKKHKLLGWVEINDCESAQEAIRQTYVVGFTLAFFNGLGYLLLIYLVYYDPEKFFAKEWQSLSLSSLFFLIPFFSAFRIKYGKLGLAPLMIVWGLAEVVYVLMINLRVFLDANADKNGFIIFIIFSIISFVLRTIWNACEGYLYFRVQKKQH